MVSAYRESPTAARRAAIEVYAVSHASSSDGALAYLALGVVAFEQKDYRAAIDATRKAQAQLPQIADYAAYYLAASRVESKDWDGIERDLQRIRSLELPSPWNGKAWVLEARVLAAAGATSGLQLLLDHYAELPQPDGDLALADAYRASGDLRHAADIYQRISIQYPTSDAATRSTAALAVLKTNLGASFPPAPQELMLRGADRLADMHQYLRARAEYRILAGRVTGLTRDKARVRIGEMDYFLNRTSIARSYLRTLEAAGEADAERLYYLVECARRTHDDSAMLAAVQRLDKQYPKSGWRLKALVSAANCYLLLNRPNDYVPLYKAAYENFPSDSSAGLYHWKVAFQAYLHNDTDSARWLREHLINYPAHNTAGAALYFLGRRAEQDAQWGVARAYFQDIDRIFPNHYYGMLARERMRRTEIAGAVADPSAVQFLAGLKLSEARPIPAEGTHASTLRIERSRLLRSAGLTDLADSELRFGARTDCPPGLIGMELAAAAQAPHQAMRIMKNISPEYLSLPLDHAPRQYWNLLFPLPFRSEVEQYARTQGIDTFLLAGLIRQESEFNPHAISRAKAYGLTQIRPGTGRKFALALGMRRLTPPQLFQPITNLQIGASILHSMLEHNNGDVEHTLASYNAGPQRLAEWMKWNDYREPAEFVESIPFTETRDYVQAVMRNADIYRRLYR
jgi:soluble lytic murein transglycosylase